MLPQKLKENLKNANPAQNFCAPHTLRNSGKRATEVAKYSEYFLKKFQKVIQYPGKAQDPMRDVFDETLDAGEIRFFVKYEQRCQSATHSPKNLCKD